MSLTLSVSVYGRPSSVNPSGRSSQECEGIGRTAGRGCGCEDCVGRSQGLDGGWWFLAVRNWYRKITQRSARNVFIVFPYLHAENTYYIKRIIGLPGETVQVVDGYTYVNGELLESDIYGAEVMESANMAAEPVVLGEDEYFVLGDNRNHSSDSRDPSVGVIKRENIMGRAWVRIYPFDEIGVIKHE